MLSKYWLPAVTRDVLMNDDVLTVMISPPPPPWQNKENASRLVLRQMWS